MLEKIQLQNSEFYQIENISQNDNLLTINFSDETDIDSLLEDISIFSTITLFTRGNTLYGEISGFVTLYQKVDNHIIILSNDKSVYTPIEYTFTSDPVPTLEEIREYKINELSGICNQKIEEGISLEINEKTESFSYKTIDQTNIKDAYELAINTKLDVPYHANEQACKLYTAEQIAELYVKEKLNLIHHTTYFNQLKMYVLTLDSKDDINAIEYGQELTGEYLETYNTTMAQTKLIVQKFLKIN